MSFSFKIPDSSEYTLDDEIFITKLKLLEAIRNQDKEAVAYFQGELRKLEEKNEDN